MAESGANGAPTGRTQRRSRPPAANGAPLALLATREHRTYNVAEQRFSSLLHHRLEELLQGRANSLLLLRTYPATPERLGIIATPAEIDRQALRVPVVRQLLDETLLFLATDAAGGPTSQSARSDGRLVEHQHFATRFPHIVIEREDVFRGEDGRCEQTTWRARRLQNQRAQTQLNRWLDVANLAASVLEPLIRSTG